MRGVVALALIGAAGCGGRTTCPKEYPASEGYGFVGDGWHYFCDEGDAACPPSVAAIEAQCAAEGHPCGGDIEVTYEAAVCVAREWGLAEGRIGPKADLLYSHTHDAPIWAVSNQLTETSGKTLDIDATTGEVLLLSQWELVVD